MSRTVYSLEIPPERPNAIEKQVRRVLRVAIHPELRHRTDFWAYRLSAIRVVVRHKLRHRSVDGREAHPLAQG